MRRNARLAIVVIAFLLPILALEAGVRALVDGGRLVPAPSHDPTFDGTWAALQEAGSVDVLLLGDSMTHSGIDPEVLEDELERQLGARPTVFNASSLGATSSLHQVVVRWLAEEHRLPRVAVLPISPVSIREADIYRDHLRFAALSSVQDGCAVDLGYEGWANCQLDRTSSLWRWRSDPRRLVQAGLAEVRHDPAAVRPGDMRPDGFVVREAISASDLHEQLGDAMMLIESDVDRLPSSVAAEYQELAGQLLSHGVAVVALPVPFSPPLSGALDRRFPGWQQRWESHARDLADAAGLPVAETFGFGSWWGEGSAVDLNHLSASGARSFTEQVWKDQAFQKIAIQALRGTSEQTS